MIVTVTSKDTSVFTAVAVGICYIKLKMSLQTQSNSWPTDSVQVTYPGQLVLQVCRFMLADLSYHWDMEVATCIVFLD